MNINMIPWPHLEIDDFYNPTLFSEMRKEVALHCKQLPLKDPKFRTKMTSKAKGIPGKKRLNGQGFKYEVNISNSEEDAFPAVKKCLAERPIDESWIKMFPAYREYGELVLLSELNILMDELNYPIHDENPSKILSVVTYLIPETGRGTVLYDKDQNYVKELEWKPNRTFIFPAITGVTWHSYNSPKGTYRITLNQFLIDKEKNTVFMANKGK